MREMTEKFWLSKETFLKIAEASGLNTKDPHMEELYTYLEKVLPSLKSFEEIDLTHLEPSMPLLSIKEHPDES
jgi:Asp-tRNA(Asn)/Glu-tRNA(Gln) amidotransferase C subunit